MSKTGSKKKMFCSKCKEPTTHVFKEVKPGETKWVCICCESGALRSEEEIAKIKAVRKGWKNTSF